MNKKKWVVNGPEIRLKRLAQMLSQKELQELTGIDSAYISKIERGNVDSCTVKTLGRIADVFKLTPADLITESEV